MIKTKRKEIYFTIHVLGHGSFVKTFKSVSEQSRIGKKVSL